MYHVLLFYKFKKISEPQAVVKKHREVCKALKLNGRVLINEQGINGTVGGSKASIEMYKDYMNESRVFGTIDFKESISDIAPFPRIIVKYREEIITTGAKLDSNPSCAGRHVDRDTFHQWLKNGEDMVILDMRNDYEWEIGRFVNAVRPPMKYFRDLKDHMAFYEQYKGKKIVMFCTGGIRCEPASAYFIKAGFDSKQLYQLEGGIVKYAEKYANDGFYEGKCFVFDERMAVPVNTSETAKIVGKCAVCNHESDNYRNCANKFCNKLFLGCDDCMIVLDRCCSDACKDIAANPENRRPAQARDKVLHRNK